MIKGKEILVTGANGFIGAWLCKALSEQNNVTALVRGSNSSLEDHGIAQDLNIIQADITNPPSPGSFNNLDFCIHLAGMTSIQECNTNPLKAIEINVKGTSNVLELCSKLGVKGVIVASSTKVYGNAKGPLLEHTPTPNTVYGLTKSHSESLTIDFSKKHSVPFVIPRLANCYGPLDPTKTRIIPSTIHSILNNQKPVIYSDGTPKRTFVYIKDVLTFMLLSLERMENGEGGVFNIGSGQSHSIEEVVKKILTLAGRSSEIEYRKSSTHSDSELSLEKALGIGWKPEYTLEKGLEETLQSYKIQCNKEIT